MAYRKILYILSLCLVPLIIVQWYFKMVWMKLDYPGFEYFALFSIVYFLAYRLVFKARKWYLQILPMWLIWVILNSVYGFRCGWADVFLSIDLYSNLVLTLWLWFTKQKVAN